MSLAADTKTFLLNLCLLSAYCASDQVANQTLRTVLLHFLQDAKIGTPSWLRDNLQRQRFTALLASRRRCQKNLPKPCTDHDLWGDIDESDKIQVVLRIAAWGHHEEGFSWGLGTQDSGVWVSKHKALIPMIYMMLELHHNLRSRG